jgi:hypothetical protein
MPRAGALMRQRIEYVELDFLRAAFVNARNPMTAMYTLGTLIPARLYMRKASSFSYAALVVSSIVLLSGCSGGSHFVPGAPAAPQGRARASGLFVSASKGSDRNDGSFARPFRTVRRCATRAHSGQTCYVSGGVYRGTVKPNSGITIRPMSGQRVTMIATVPVTNWKVYSGSIYVASVTLDPTLPANQVFIGPGTTMLNEAQYPAPSSNPLQPNWAVEAAGSTSTQIVDPKLPSANLQGAIVNVWSGTDPWAHIEGPVSASYGGSLSFTPNGGVCPPSNCYVESMPGGFYYVTGALALLTAPGEWWYDATNKLLYLWAPNGTNPNYLDVEAKNNQVLVDLSGKSDVTVSDVTLIGGGIMMNSSSSGNTIDGITALYPSQVLYSSNMYRTFYSYPEGSGLVLDGSNNTIENSTIAYSATNGVLLRGTNNSVTNSLIHDVDWIGDYSAGVLPITGHNSITHDTIYNTGRSALEDDYSVKMPTPNLVIANNNFFNTMFFSVDGGAIYTTSAYGNVATGTQIYDNWLHSEINPYGHLPPSNTCKCPWAGLYIDSGMGGIKANHNVIWNSFPDMSVFPSKEVHVNDNTLSDSGTKGSMWLGCYGTCDDKYPRTGVAHNLIYVGFWNRGQKPVPQKDNSSTAPGAGSIPTPGCTIAGCNVGGLPPFR